MSRGTLIWLNGELLPSDQPVFTAYTHTLHYGTSIFEGIRAYASNEYGGYIFRLEDHLMRFEESAKMLCWTLPFSREEIHQACLQVCAVNAFHECYIRPFAVLTNTALSVMPDHNTKINVGVLAWHWPSCLSQQAQLKGARVKVSSFIRPHVNSVMTKGKIGGHYINNILGKTEAQHTGFDDALFLDSDGYVTEASGSNVFIVKNNIIKTTPLNSILNGITRQSVITIFQKSGYTILEQKFSRDELWCSDEIFLTGTAMEVNPVTEVDHRVIGNGKIGDITRWIQEQYHKIVRGKSQHTEYLKWLTPTASSTLDIPKTSAAELRSTTTIF